MRQNLIVLLVSLGVLSTSCNENNQEILTNIQPTVDLTFIRYDEIIDSLNRVDPLHIVAQSQALYPAVSTIYYDYLLQLPPGSAQSFIQGMLQDTSYVTIYQLVKDKFGDLSSYHAQLAQAIENFNVEMNEAHLPNIYTLMSSFSTQSFVFEDDQGEAIGIGLDMFLGPAFDYKRVDGTNPLFADYLSIAYQPEFLPKKLVESLLEDRMDPPAKNDFLHLMIWEGKKLYAMDKILSFLPDRMIAEYTEEQLNWCKQNEAEMWNFFFKENLFYETDIKKFNKLVSPSPSSPGMPVEAPGRTGSYMGWQIIKEYMRRYPQTSLKELLAISDAQSILDDSKYKPVRS